MAIQNFNIQFFAIEYDLFIYFDYKSKQQGVSILNVQPVNQNVRNML